MNEDLKFTLTEVNGWLRYAETKNAGLLALNIGAIVGVLKLDQVFAADEKIFENLLIFLFGVSACICMYSINPITKKGFRFFKKMENEKFQQLKSSINLLFFKDIAELSTAQYIELFESKHGVSLSEPERDFGDQITNNAEIALQKHSLFRIASWICLAALVLAIFVLVAR